MARQLSVMLVIGLLTIAHSYAVGLFLLKIASAPEIGPFSVREIQLEMQTEVHDGLIITGW